MNSSTVGSKTIAGIVLPSRNKIINSIVLNLCSKHEASDSQGGASNQDSRCPYSFHVPWFSRYYHRIQLFSTGILIVLLIIIVTPITIFKASDKHSTEKSIEIMNPTLQHYDTLYGQHVDTLICTCSQPAISHDAFIRIDYSLHSICNSYYVTDQWIDAFSNFFGLVGTIDFRVIGPKIFQTLDSLCQLANRSIQTALFEFFSDNHISYEVTQAIAFSSIINTKILNFISSTTSKFALSLQFISETTQANALFSSFMTNYKIYVQTGSNYPVMVPVRYGSDCVCTRTNACLRGATLDGILSDAVTWDVPGFYVGCYILEALRQSHLGCLYNQSCLNSLVNVLAAPGLSHLVALNRSALKHFTPETPIHSLIDELMVNYWNSTIDYGSYYDRCRPKSCTYRMKLHEDDHENMITATLGTIGGIAAILNIITIISMTAILEYVQRTNYPRQLAVRPLA